MKTPECIRYTLGRMPYYRMDTRKTIFLAETKKPWRMGGSAAFRWGLGLGAVTPSRYVRIHARSRGAPSTPARCPAPRPSPTPHTLSIARARTLPCECIQLHSNRGIVRVLNPSCTNCLTRGALHPVRRASTCERQHKEQHLSLSVCECLCVFPRAPNTPDGQELTLCDALLEGPVSPPASEDHLARSRGDGSDTST